MNTVQARPTNSPRLRLGIWTSLAAAGTYLEFGLPGINPSYIVQTFAGPTNAGGLLCVAVGLFIQFFSTIKAISSLLDIASQRKEASS